MACTRGSRRVHRAEESILQTRSLCQRLQGAFPNSQHPFFLPQRVPTLWAAMYPAAHSSCSYQLEWRVSLNGWRGSGQGLLGKRLKVQKGTDWLHCPVRFFSPSFLLTMQIGFQLYDHEAKLKLKSMSTVTTTAGQEQGTASVLENSFLRRKSKFPCPSHHRFPGC